MAGDIAVGTGEGALAVTEKLGFRQRFRQRRAVDAHEGAVGAPAFGMYHMRQ
jgi:hypothetical protein